MAALNLTVDTLSGSKLSLSKQIFSNISRNIFPPVMLGVAIVAGGGHQGGRRPQVAAGGARVGRAVVAWIFRTNTTTPATEARVSGKYLQYFFKKYLYLYLKYLLKLAENMK